MNVRCESDAVLLEVLVTPRASRAGIGEVHDGRLKIAVTAPPVDGAANAAVIEVLRKALGVKRRDVEVVAGHSSRRKTVRIASVSRAAVRGLAS